MHLTSAPDVPTKQERAGTLAREARCMSMGVAAWRKKRKNSYRKALEYDPEDDAPRVIASGRGALAERIIEKAQESNVPVHRDDKLADTLSKLDIGDMIPPELYEVVAEILIFVDSMDKLKSKIKKR